MAGSPAVTLVAQKYVPEVLAGIERPLDYRDARVEARSIIVKTAEMDPKLGGWLGYAVTVGKTGKLGSPSPVVYAEPSIVEFLTWAKQQSVKELTRLLAASGIKATGNIVFMLAYRLTYLYEELWHKRHETWPLEPSRMAVREKKIGILDQLIHVKGVGTHPNEEAIAKKLLMEQGAVSATLHHREEPAVADETPEKKSETLKRLRAQAAAEEKGKGKDKKKGALDEQVTTGTESMAITEAAAVKAGKGKHQPAAAPTAEPPAAKPAATHEEESAVKKGTGKASKKASTKSSSKPAAKAKPEKKGNPTAKAKDFAVGVKVKYVGTRVKHHIGKSGEVVGHIGDAGLKIKWSDGMVATATAMSVEKVK